MTALISEKPFDLRLGELKPITRSPASDPMRAELGALLDHTQGGGGQIDLVGSITPGCSAVSPPRSAQPAAAQAAAIEETMAVSRCGSRAPTAM